MFRKFSILLAMVVGILMALVAIALLKVTSPVPLESLVLLVVGVALMGTALKRTA